MCQLLLELKCRCCSKLLALYVNVTTAQHFNVVRRLREKNMMPLFSIHVCYMSPGLLIGPYKCHIHILYSIIIFFTLLKKLCSIYNITQYCSIIYRNIKYISNVTAHTHCVGVESCTLYFKIFVYSISCISKTYLGWDGDETKYWKILCL